jgi:hypothetical protein
LKGDDILAPGSIREGEPPHYLLASIYPRLPAVPREELQETVLVFLGDLAENPGSEWRGKAGEELLMLLDPVPDSVSSTGRSHRSSIADSKLLLDASIWGPPTAEEEALARDLVGTLLETHRR